VTLGDLAKYSVTRNIAQSLRQLSFLFVMQFGVRRVGASCNIVSDTLAISRHLFGHLLVHIAKLKKGKATGLDGIVNEHILYGGECLAVHICLSFNAIHLYRLNSAMVLSFHC